MFLNICPKSSTKGKLSIPEEMTRKRRRTRKMMRRQRRRRGKERSVKSIMKSQKTDMHLEAFRLFPWRYSKRKIIDSGMKWTLDMTPSNMQPVPESKLNTVDLIYSATKESKGIAICAMKAVSVRVSTWILFQRRVSCPFFNWNTHPLQDSPFGMWRGWNCRSFQYESAHQALEEEADWKVVWSCHDSGNVGMHIDNEDTQQNRGFAASLGLSCPPWELVGEEASKLHVPRWLNLEKTRLSPHWSGWTSPPLESIKWIQKRPLPRWIAAD